MPATRSANPKDSAKQVQFRSPKELREILNAVMKEIEADPDEGPRLRAAAAPLRLEFTDLNLALNISPAEKDGSLRWDFSRRSKSKPRLRLRMDSDFANRMLQGGENPAIAIARGRLQTNVVDVGAALRFFPAAKPLFSRYRQLVSEKYPHLAIDAE